MIELLFSILLLLHCWCKFVFCMYNSLLELFKTKMESCGVLCSSLRFRRKWLLPYIFTLCQSSDAVSSDPDNDLCSVPVTFAVWIFSCPNSENTVCTVFTQLCCSVKLTVVYIFISSVYTSVGDGTLYFMPKIVHPWSGNLSDSYVVKNSFSDACHV